MKKILFLVFASAAQAVGQDVTMTKPKIQYYFNLVSGMMTGEKARSITYTASTAHGITFGPHLRIAGGVGIDAYDHWQTMPLFAQASYDVLQRKNPVFIQASYGWSHAWMQRDGPSYYKTADTGGRMLTAMLGYRLSEGNVRVYVAAGYKMQLVSTRYETPVDPASSVPYSLYGYSEKIEYKFERFVLTIGVGWR